MKSTGKSPVSTNKSPMAVYINDVSPGPADCKRLDPSEVQFFFFEDRKPKLQKTGSFDHGSPLLQSLASISF
ncbi:hypothetical protein YC2023_116407 [Brassica napus]